MIVDCKMDRPYIIVAYYTSNIPYPSAAQRFIKSLKQFNLVYEITSIKDLGDWYKNTQYKPVFLQEKLKMFYPYSLVYVDIDAVICHNPVLFNQLDDMSHVNIAVHVLDHSQRKRKNNPPELLSGTIYLKNTEETSIIVNEWITECNKNPKLWDQRALDIVLKDRDFYHLPDEYCTIFDYMVDVKDPVIKHFQASRIAKGQLKNIVKNPNVIFVANQKVNGVPRHWRN